MLEQLGCTYMMINGSEESGIDVLRNKIKNFASTVSMDGKRKYVILDEADYLNPQSTQPALRGFIEEFSKNCGFILTCNFRNRIIEPLHSRCSLVEFRIPTEEKPKLAMDFMHRCEEILNTENIKFNKKVVASLIQKFFPDWRRVLNELQRYSASGEIDLEFWLIYLRTQLKNLSDFLKKKSLPMFVDGLSTILIMTQAVFIVGFTIPFMIVWILLLFPTLLLYLLIMVTSPLLLQTKK